MTFSPEFRLALACSIWPPSRFRETAICAAASVPVDWEKFLRIVRRQHVAGLVYRALGDSQIEVPASIRGSLGEAATRIAQSNLLRAVECRQIQDAFDVAGIPVVFVKGTTLGALAYGELGLKYSYDIDILVQPDDVARAIGLLDGIGYRGDPPFPDVSGPVYRHWIKFGQEYLFVRSGTGTKVELHWRLATNDAVLTGVSPLSDTQTVFVADGIELRTLANDDLLIYLCIHGARHNWARLKWLADVNALLSRTDRDGLHRLLARVRQSNADICMAQTIMLCDTLFGTPQLAAIAKTLRKTPRHRYLKRLALHYLAAGGGENDNRYGAFGQFVMYFSRYLLGRGFRYRYSEFKMQMFLPFDLFFHPETAGSRIYPILRVVRWLGRTGRPRLPPSSQSGAPDRQDRRRSQA